MGNFDEKAAIYEQMRLLIEERREISKLYFELKEKLTNLEKEKSINISDNKAIVNKKIDLSKDIEHQKYILSKKYRKQTSISYQDIGVKIASLLKEAGRPLATREIYNFLKDSYNYSSSYNNLVSNILPKINNDSSINVEKSYRGYWQYRLK